jgi:geranyl-CoA carboxylase alpha subunit
MRTAAAQGYRTVAVYSDADADAPHVRLADVAVPIGPAPARESYLDIVRLIGAAAQSGAKAIHPGYGFLSENADFAQACADAGLVFVGPTPETIRAMGDKAAAKRLMADAGVPLLAGYQAMEQSDDRLLVEAVRIGFPLMVKAAAGGGGRGMRMVADAEALPAALQAARREALSAFGSDVLILERAVLRPRHVEVQILADMHGHVIALGERDCSVQRRHQKVVEESPCPVIDNAARRALWAAAVTAAKSVGYVGAGTVEFILDADGTFAFLEMNTRLQVEHPVTEMVTNLDLVAWQLRIAQGEPLTMTQEQLRFDGHAIEVRLYAEDPGNGYVPATGRIELWRPPAGDGVRVDAGIDTGVVVSPHYDPMLAKIIAHGRDREEARRRLINALEHTTVLGVTTNRCFLARILRDPTFAAGQATTALLDEVDLVTGAEPSTRELAAAAGLLHRKREQVVQLRSPGLAGWTNAAVQHGTQRLQTLDRTHEIRFTRTDRAIDVEIDGATHVLDAAGEGLVRVDGEALSVDAWCVSADRIAIRFSHLDLDVREDLFDPPEAKVVSGSGVITAPMHGIVTASFVEIGAVVAAGQRLLVLEAMKMEQPVLADVAGTVTEIACAGTQVATDDVLVRIEPAASTADDEEQL